MAAQQRTCLPSSSLTRLTCAFIKNMAALSEKANPAALENASEKSDEIADKRRPSAASHVLQNTDDTDLPDPDEGKSDEERRKIVRAITRPARNRY